jgi:hypothetical protein
LPLRFVHDCPVEALPAGATGEQLVAIVNLELVGILPRPPLDVLFNLLVVLELAAALMLEREQPSTRALRVAANAPVGAQWPLQLLEVKATARAVRSPLRLATPPAERFKVRR